MNIVVAGGSGFIGRAFIRAATDAGDRVVLLTRNGAAAESHVQDHVDIEEWDGKTQGAWAKRIEGCDAVVNLAGESIAAKRWTEERKNVLIQSRIQPTHALIDAIASAKRKPSVLVNASGVGYFGDVPSGDVIESSPPGKDFLARLCESWEREASSAGRFGVRVVPLRIGVVLARNGGALKKMILPFRLFVGGSIGSGKQWFPWIHVDDMVGIIRFVLKETSLAGPLIAAAPGVVTMRQFAKSLGSAMKRPSWIPVPAKVLVIGLGELSSALLTGQKAVPRKILDAGYEFQHPLLTPALEEIFGSG